MKCLYRFCLAIVLCVLGHGISNAQHIKPFTEVIIGGSVSPWQRLNTNSASTKQLELSLFVESSLNVIPVSVGIMVQGLGSFTFDPYTLKQRKLGGYLRYQLNLNFLPKQSIFLSAKAQYHLIESTLIVDPKSGVPNQSLISEKHNGYGYMLSGAIGTYLGPARVELSMNYSSNDRGQYLIGDFNRRSMDLSTQSVSISLGIPIAIGAPGVFCPRF